MHLHKTGPDDTGGHSVQKETLPSLHKHGLRDCLRPEARALAS
ncbi:hypothetical protein BVG79_01445 [Ketogulonicigenium robustum]|uniref:Uncharacterized protein n=1 Tax=Ketogulonicigenium robustum TaxID=92947 RepID=A0A1W6P058_9RHOB|nr:hypothetical protein BVG79_01445 [Ketogulonicigenium robustum]